MLLRRKPQPLPTDAAADALPRRLLRPTLYLLLPCFLLLLSYLFLYSNPHLCLPCAFISSPPPRPYSPADHPLGPFLGAPTNLSHLFFALGGSAATWPHRRNYSHLWWRPGETRGFVWLDHEPPSNSSSSSSSPPGWPPYRVSLPDPSRFGPRAAAARIARIVKDAYDATLEVEGDGNPEVRWLVMGDDDTVFFVDNLVGVLGRYDHREPYYIGGTSESVEQDVLHSYGMAFGGGGFAVSLPAAREAASLMDGCLGRYAGMWGSDERVHACMSEIGVPLTREPGFHQVDLRGSLYGILAAHPVAPVVSLHHLDYVDSIFPGSGTQLEALSRLVAASRVDPARMLQQSICYERTLNWSVSVSWGYAAEVHPHVIAPVSLEVPPRTFRTWRSWQEGPFTFNTRPPGGDACDRPVVFFLDTVHAEREGRGSVVEYRRQRQEGGGGGEGCERPEYVAASRVEVVRLTAPKVDPSVWTRAPRRQCCKVERSWWGTKMDVRIRRCQPGESLVPP